MLITGFTLPSCFSSPDLQECSDRTLIHPVAPGRAVSVRPSSSEVRSGRLLRRGSGASDRAKADGERVGRERKTR